MASLALFFPQKSLRVRLWNVKRFVASSNHQALCEAADLVNGLVALDSSDKISLELRIGNKKLVWPHLFSLSTLSLLVLSPECQRTYTPSVEPPWNVCRLGDMCRNGRNSSTFHFFFSLNFTIFVRIREDEISSFSFFFYVAARRSNFLGCQMTCYIHRRFCWNCLACHGSQSLAPVECVGPVLCWAVESSIRCGADRWNDRRCSSQRERES
jgi:hypothetical protein